MLRVKTVKNIWELKVKWILEDWSNDWEYATGSLISHILGHEGPNSLLSILIKEGLALGLSSSHSTLFNYTDLENKGNFEEFTLAIWCTEKGLQNYEQIIGIIFGAILKLSLTEIKEF